MSEAIANLMNVPFRCREVSCLFIMRIRPAASGSRFRSGGWCACFSVTVEHVPKGGVPALFSCVAFREKAKRPFRVCDWPLFLRASFRKGVERLLFARDIPFAHERSLSRPFIMPSSSASILGKCFALYFTACRPCRPVQRYAARRGRRVGLRRARFNRRSCPFRWSRSRWPRQAAARS